MAEFLGMQEVSEAINYVKVFMPLIRTIITVVVVFIVFSFILSVIKKSLLKRAKRKKQISNIEIFSKVLKLIFLVLLVMFALSSYSGSWAGLGIGIGLFSAALGWALQKPITGVAGWIMVITKRPFEIGDRVIIGSVRGDVADITLTHIYLKEIGGIVAGEENSGRIIMVPNSTLFEQNIINYTQEYEYILDQISFTVTYESNLDKAIKIGLEAARKCTKNVIDEIKKEPYVRTYFDTNGIIVHVRYYSPAKNIQEVSSNVTKETFDRIMKTKGVEISYPHTKVLFEGKKGVV
ncbi:mechanosensitive ion channel family protein [Candidatus Woesearchaeota archaeon]|nr:mechanosensitive ion channel family protein [Candidatus Woesearchaeota archaeon]